MVMCIEDFVSSSGADAAGDVPQSSYRDSATWKSLYDRERIRAKAAEARTAVADARTKAAEGRCEELRLQEVEGRSRANSLKAIFESNREKLAAARAEVREVRRTAKQFLALKQEVARPGRLLAEAGARKRSTVVSLRMENAGLKTAMRVLKGRGARGGERQASQVVDVRAQEREEAAGAIEVRPAVRHSWPRPALEEVEERLEVAEDARSCCGTLPTVCTRIIEIRAHKRRIVRPRRGCDCPGSPSEVAARLFPGTAFGCGRMCCTSACMRPLRRAARPGAFAGNAGQLHEPDAAPVRAASGRDPRAPERGESAPCRCIRALREVRKSRRACSGRRSAVTRSSSTPRAAPRSRRSCSRTPSAPCIRSATATAPARSWRACGPSSSCAVAGRIVGATFRTAPAAAGGVGGRMDRSRRSAA